MINVKIEHIQKEKIEPFFDQWEDLRVKIHDMHQSRNKEVKQLMESGISLYERLIAFSCGQANESSLHEEEYEVLPLNGLERLKFIKTRPGQFASFRQLDELFKETKKRIARLRLQK